MDQLSQEAVVKVIRLKENASFLGFDGIIGRLDFIKFSMANSLIWLAYLTVALGAVYVTNGMIFQVSDFSHLSLPMIIIGIISFFFVLALTTYLGWGLTFRRVKDILRSTDNAVPATVAVFVLSFIPYVGLLVGLVLSAWPGELHYRDEKKNVGKPGSDYEVVRETLRQEVSARRNPSE